MSKRFCAIFCIFFLLSISTADEAKSSSTEKLPYSIDEWSSIDELPSIIISYYLYIKRYPEFKSLESTPQNILIKLRKNLDALSLGITHDISFVHMAFIVQNNIQGHVSGYFRIKNKTLKESGVPYESMLFVTTPIESFGNRVLVIISSVSPERTTIFSVGNNLSTELLYDTFDKNDIKNKEEMLSSGSTDSMYSIFNVRVEKPGVFLLEERRDRGSVHPFHPTIEGRKFIIDVTKDKFELSMKKQKRKEMK